MNFGRGGQTLSAIPAINCIPAVCGAAPGLLARSTCRLGTAMHAVHAIAPGIRTFLDLPLLTGRHVLRS